MKFEPEESYAGERPIGGREEGEGGGGAVGDDGRRASREQSHCYHIFSPVNSGRTQPTVVMWGQQCETEPLPPPFFPRRCVVVSLSPSLSLSQPISLFLSPPDCVIVSVRAHAVPLNCLVCSTPAAARGGLAMPCPAVRATEQGAAHARLGHEAHLVNH